MCQCCVHIETSHLICTAYQLTGFYMRVTPALNGLNKSNKCTMEVRRLRVLVLEVFRSVNKLNPVYMQSLFENNVNSKRHKDDLKVPTRNFVTFGDKSVKGFRASHLEHVTSRVKKRNIIRKYKIQTNNSIGPKCYCSARNLSCNFTAS